MISPWQCLAGTRAPGGCFPRRGLMDGEWPGPPHSPGDTGQVGDEPPEVLLPYSVMVAAGREGEDGTPTLVSATCKQTRAHGSDTKWRTWLLRPAGGWHHHHPGPGLGRPARPEGPSKGQRPCSAGTSSKATRSGRVSQNPVSFLQRVCSHPSSLL